MTDIIGQLKARKQLSSVHADKCILLIGPNNSGRRTIIQEYAQNNSMQISHVGYKVDDIRNMILDAQNNVERVLYLVTQGSKMTLSAQNSILKIAEEPLKNCLIVILVESVDDVLPTIKSRSIPITMSVYTKKELVSYLMLTFSKEEAEQYYKLARTIGDLKILIENDIKKVYEVVSFVHENIFEVSTANALNIMKYLKMKDSDNEKVDPRIFLECIRIYNLRALALNHVKQSLNSSVTSNLERHYVLDLATARAISKLNKSQNLSITMNCWAIESTGVVNEHH